MENLFVVKVKGKELYMKQDGMCCPDKMKAYRTGASSIRSIVDKLNALDSKIKYEIASY